MIAFKGWFFGLLCGVGVLAGMWFYDSNHIDVLRRYTAKNLRRGTIPSHSVSICTMARDEHLDVGEWLDYHYRLGIYKVIILDNNSTTADQFQQSLNFVKSGFVEYVWFNPTDGKSTQMSGYEHCLSQYGHMTPWMAFIDLDEFIFINRTKLHT
jgi:hypothetical protein